MELLASERTGEEETEDGEVDGEVLEDSEEAEDREDGEERLEGQDKDDEKEGGEIEANGAEIEVLQVLAEVELGETEQVRRSGLAQLRTWLEAQSHIHNCRTDDNFLLRFLRMQKHKVPASCQAVERYLRMREEHPHYFRRLEVEDPAFKELVELGFLFVLPDRDQEGRRVIFSIPRKLEPSRHTTTDAIRAHIIIFEALLESEEEQIRGFSYIFDCSGLSLAHLTMWNPLEVRKVFTILEKNLPMRHRDINFLSLPLFVGTMFEFVKKLLSVKIQKRIQTHPSLSSLTAKLGCSILPQEYGGTLALADITRQFGEELSEAGPRLMALDETSITLDKARVAFGGIFSWKP